eukprot:5978098-Pleurochrysis_carterae.AAC.1
MGREEMGEWRQSAHVLPRSPSRFPNYRPFRSTQARFPPNGVHRLCPNGVHRLSPPPSSAQKVVVVVVGGGSRSILETRLMVSLSRVSPVRCLVTSLSPMDIGSTGLSSGANWSSVGSASSCSSTAGRTHTSSASM